MDPASAIKIPLDLYIVGGLGFSPDSATLAVPYLNGHLVAWDVPTGESRAQTERVRGIGVSAMFSSDGSRFVVAGNDHRITMWDTATLEQVSEFVGHSSRVCEASFSPDGTRVVSFSRDHTLRLWEAATGREIVTLFRCDKSHEIVAARFSPDGRSIYAALDDGTVRALRTTDWNTEAYSFPGAPLNFRQSFELRKRRIGLGEHVTPEDILATPPVSNL